MLAPSMVVIASMIGAGGLDETVLRGISGWMSGRVPRADGAW